MHIDRRDRLIPDGLKAGKRDDGVLDGCIALIASLVDLAPRSVPRGRPRRRGLVRRKSSSRTQGNLRGVVRSCKQQPVGLCPNAKVRGTICRFQPDPHDPVLSWWLQGGLGAPFSFPFRFRRRRRSCPWARAQAMVAAIDHCHEARPLVGGGKGGSCGAPFDPHRPWPTRHTAPRPPRTLLSR